MTLFSYHSSKTRYINSTSLAAPDLLALQLRSLLTYSSDHSPVFVCIGTDKIIGDSLGPIIGSMLQNTKHFPFAVYGTLPSPVHALNLESYIPFIRSRHPANPIIAIDASLGSKKHLQYITISKGALSPGSGMSKSLPKIGDISITGIINTSGNDAFLSLQTVCLSKVVTLASCITQGILLAYNI